MIKAVVNKAKDEGLKILFGAILIHIFGSWISMEMEDF